VLRRHENRTENLMAERKLLIAERLASLGRTGQAVAHELKTPHATIQTLAADTPAARPSAPPAARDYAKDLDGSATPFLDETRRCRSITQALLAGRDRLQKNGQDGDLGFAVERAATLVFGTGSARRILSTDRELEGLFVAMAADSLVQVFVNLLQNAQDAMADRPDGRIRISRTEAEPGIDRKSDV